MNTLIKTLIVSLIFTCGAMQAHAEELLRMQTTIGVTEKEEMDQKMADPDATVVENKQTEEYSYGSVENFSKLYWKLGALDVNNKDAVDNFLRINECDIYQAFYHDDFQWSDVRTAAAQMLQKERSTFSNKFAFMIPIDLGRYDAQRGGFPLVTGTGITNLRRVQMGGNNFSKPICGKEGNVPYYPRNIVLVLNRPLTFEFLELDEHVAQAFIISQKYSKANMSKADFDLGYQRLAFLQLNTTISHFQGIQTGSKASGEQFAIVYGKIDSIDIYADRKKNNLLKTVKFQQRKKRAKRPEDAASMTSE